jgi:Zn-finger nucleic acid-binding protein
VARPGELDKITERAPRFVDDDEDRRPSRERPRDRDREDDRHDDDRDRYYRKRRSFWTELFD